MKKIGIISPSNNLSNIFPNRNKTGIENLKNIGFETIFSKNALRYNSCSKKSVQERLDEINELIDKDIDFIMASIGGYTSIQLLDKLDYDKIKEKNITFCGFSDITALLLAIYVKTKLIMLYGPTYIVNLCDYEGIDEYTKNSMLDCYNKKNTKLVPSNFYIDKVIDWNILENKKMYKERIRKADDWNVVNKGSAEGKLIGGNLTTLLLILGTEYLPVDMFNDKILFLEECDISIEEFCSHLDSLKLKGVLQKVKGVFVGKFNTKETNEQAFDFLKEYFSDYDIPVACNLDFGHVFPCMTIPIGADAQFVCDEKVNLNIMFDK